MPLAASELEVGVLMRFLRVPRRASDMAVRDKLRSQTKCDVAVRDKLRGQTKCDETVLSSACNVGRDRFAQILAAPQLVMSHH